MKYHWLEAWRMLKPRADDPHGPLAPMLVILTVVTGLVDAFSYLELGRVFVANMTGNVVFLSFALGGAPGFIWWASLLAVAAFFLGAFLGGRITAAAGEHRGRHLRTAAATQCGLLLLAVVLTLVVPAPATGQSYQGALLGVLILLLGIAMGLQNATARTLAVPDLTTTVLTLTITGIGSDSTLAGGKNSRAGRRMLSVLAMFAGGLVGVLLIQAGLSRWVLICSALLLLGVTLLAARSAGSTGPWVSPRS
ncbi:YoaK family protein [Arthrobacter sp. NPDC090010]|uniref:YoaK family protein n=1 Tax=Arthrobacter sp. NPDC090010 TaxID=3363942 RepID=UPI003818DE57